MQSVRKNSTERPSSQYIFSGSIKCGDYVKIKVSADSELGAREIIRASMFAHWNFCQDISDLCIIRPIDSELIGNLDSIGSMDLNFFHSNQFLDFREWIKIVPCEIKTVWFHSPSIQIFSYRIEEKNKIEEEKRLEEKTRVEERERLNEKHRLNPFLNGKCRWTFTCDYCDIEKNGDYWYSTMQMSGQEPKLCCGDKRCIELDSKF